MKIIFSEKQVADPGLQPIGQKGFTSSPSAHKPREVAKAFQKLGCEFVDPEPVTLDDIKRVHDSFYVDGVMNLQLENGFETISQSVTDSLPYTNGAQYTAAKLATKPHPTCALVSGFHHAGYYTFKGLGYFCTFNGLMIAAAKLLHEKQASKVAIIDCDMHWGNGTDNILDVLPEYKKSIPHLTFGKYFSHPRQADSYLKWLQPNGKVQSFLEKEKPDIIIYQAGADVHIDDPYGGILNTEQIYQRDLSMFKIAKELKIPLTWNLAGGYQIDEKGNIDKVIEIHVNTLKACKEVYEA